MSFLRTYRAVMMAAVAVALSATITVAAPPRLPISEATTSFMLGNGLQVVVIPDHRTPVVTQMVWYRAGASDDPIGKSGIAHFLEHLMFKGTTTYPDGRFSQRVSAFGGNDNAFTTDDFTVYHQSVAKEHLGEVMGFEADRMANLVISDETLLPEREVILEERRSRIDNNPGSRLFETMNATLYQNSHYGIPTIGWAHEMATLNRDDAVGFYERYYTPNNAILVVAGDVTEAEVRRLAEGTYGELPRRAEPTRMRTTEPEPQAPRTVTLADPRVTQPSLLRLYLTPSYATAKDGEAEALDVLGEILGGGSTSRFFRRLVVDQSLATGAGAGYRGTQLGETTFSVYGAPRGELTLAELESAIDRLIADTVNNGVTEAELAAAKRRMFAGMVYAQDNHSTLARIYGQAVATGNTIEDVRNWPGKVDAVTVEQVNAVARKYLDIKRSVTGYQVSAPEGKT